MSIAIAKYIEKSRSKWKNTFCIKKNPTQLIAWFNKRHE